MKSIIYFVLADRLGIVKIGVTTHLKRRLLGLQTISPARLELLATMPGDAAVERALHDKFSAERMHGEWFRRSLHLQNFIDDVNAGKVKDIAGLGTRVLIERDGKRFSATPEQIFGLWKTMCGARWHKIAAERWGVSRETIFHWEKAAAGGICRIPKAAFSATLDFHDEKMAKLRKAQKWLQASLDYDEEGNYVPDRGRDKRSSLNIVP